MRAPKQLVYTLDFAEIGLKDVNRVGGKNASLGELFNSLKPKGVGVIDGFATTADAYRSLLAQGELEYELRSLVSDFDHLDVEELRRRGHAARVAILDMPLPKELRDAIINAYEQLCKRLGREPELAVRSSATAEDLPEASFAGTAETFLNNYFSLKDLNPVCGSNLRKLAQQNTSEPAALKIVCYRKRNLSSFLQQRHRTRDQQHVPLCRYRRLVQTTGPNLLLGEPRRRCRNYFEVKPQPARLF